MIFSTLIGDVQSSSAVNADIHLRISILFVGLAWVGKDIAFRFIIEYSSLRDFDPWVIGLFLYKDF
jgi:hypothetical protein